MSNQVAVLGPVYLKKTCPVSKGHLLNWFYFSEHLYEKKFDPFARANSNSTSSDCLKQCLHMLWLFGFDRIDPAGQAKLFTWRKVGMARRVTLPAKSTFCFPCSPHFVRKWVKSWPLTQGSVCRWVTFLINEGLNWTNQITLLEIYIRLTFDFFYYLIPSFSCNMIVFMGIFS